MAGAAILGHVRSCGIVRIVAAHAGFAGIVHGRLDLRKTCRPRRIVTVAEWATTPVAWRSRNLFIRRLRMLRRRTVADFAGESPVIGIGLQCNHIIVTFRAGLGSGIIDVQSGDFVNGLRPVMAVLAERVGRE